MKSRNKRHSTTSTVILHTALFFVLCSLPLQGADLSPDLRAAVDQLKADVERSPTDRSNAASRMAVLWRWANAVSLAGGFVPKNLPLAAYFVPNPTPGTQLGRRYLEAIDLYVRQLAMLEQDSGALGTVRVDPEVEAIALSWQTISVRFEVGSRGIDDGGGFLISRHVMGGYPPLQVNDPAGDNFVSIATDRTGISFTVDEASVWGPYGGFRAPRPFPVYRVRGGRLRPGDRVTLTYGDRSGGGRGVRVGSFSNTAIALPLHLDPGDGRFYEMPPATYRVIGGRATRVHGFAPSIVAVGEPFEISVRSEDRYYNRATSELPDELPGYEVLLNGRRFGSLEAGRAIHALPVTLEREGVYRFTFRSLDGRIEGAANPIWARTAPGRRIYWGETHGHCGFAEGQGTPEGYFEFARDDACLDFVTLSEHDIWLTDGEWRYLNEVAERFHRDGELAVYVGYEWTAPRQRGGHHNVLFRRPGMKRVGVQMAPNLSELYRGLRAVHDPSDVLIIPHAHQASDWRQSDYDLENLVEIMSSHGTFEWFGQRYLEHGHRVGFVGASDDHLGHPGYAPGHPASPTRRSNIFQFGGLVGVVSNRGDSNAIFDALKARSAYATTGSQRIILEARLNGHDMGTAQKQRKERKVVGRVIGTQPIRTISLIKNSKVVDRFDLGRPSGGESGTLEVLVGFYSESKVHIRDNPRGHHTWRGALTVSGAQLSSAWFLGTPNTTADRLERDGNRIVFDVATRGAGRTLALRLRGATETTRFRFDLQATREMGTAPRQVRAADRFPAEGFVLNLPQGAETSEKTFATDYHKDRVTVERLRRRSDFEFQFTDRGRPGDWYYVRVEQTDGHLAWTSPWWVGGERPR